MLERRRQLRCTSRNVYQVLGGSAAIATGMEASSRLHRSNSRGKVKGDVLKAVVVLEGVLDGSIIR